MGGLFSVFHKKSASKAQKTCYFAYSTSQWGGSSLPPPPGYATADNLLLLYCALTKRIRDGFSDYTKLKPLICSPTIAGQ